MVRVPISRRPAGLEFRVRYLKFNWKWRIKLEFAQYNWIILFILSASSWSKFRNPGGIWSRFGQSFARVFPRVFPEFGQSFARVFGRVLGRVLPQILARSPPQGRSHDQKNNSKLEVDFGGFRLVFPTFFAFWRISVASGLGPATLAIYRPLYGPICAP